MAEPIEESGAQIKQLILATGTSNPSVITFEPLEKQYSAWQASSGNSVPLKTVLQALKRGKWNSFVQLMWQESLQLTQFKPDGKVDFSIRGQAAALRWSDQGTYRSFSLKNLKIDIYFSFFLFSVFLVE
jgi:hypothetical protein